MESLTTVAAGYVADKFVERAEAAVKTHVIERWSRYRARKFFETFCDELLDVSLSDVELQAKLDALLDDEDRSAVVFDAYRAVCLTKSRDLGPRVIALLTAELVSSDTRATEEDDMVFAAAEELGDSELEEAASYAAEQQQLCARQVDNAPRRLADGTLVVELHKEHHDSGRSSLGAIDIGPIDLGITLGRWALKAKRIGLLSDAVTEEHEAYQADSEYHIDEDGVSRTLRWSVVVVI